MKFTVASILTALSATASAHTIFHQVAVNGQVKPAYSGVRAQNSNNPIMNVQASDFACGNDVRTTSSIITVNAGDKIGTYWQHVPGNDGTNDADNPIAASHKGPMQAYLAKVDNAATANGASAKWTKIASEGLNTQTGRWAVDDLISNAGWWNFNLPTCIVPGDYLLRAEIIAHHESSAVGKAQFYFSCAQIRVVAGGSTSIAGQGVSFPGAYSATDPGILVSIYGPDGKPDNGLKPYTAPGPAVLTCGAGSGPITTPGPAVTPTPTTMATGVKPTSTTAPPATTPPATGGAPLYGQCGGLGWTGPQTCAVGTCKYGNDWYSQCLN